MATASSQKTLQHFCSAQVYQTHTNQLPSNTWITSQLLPTTNSLTSLRESFKKRIGKRPMLSDRDLPPISSRLRRTLGKSVRSVARQTTQHKITGLGGRTQIKRAKDKSPKKQIHLERRRQRKRQRAKKRHQ